MRDPRPPGGFQQGFSSASLADRHCCPGRCEGGHGQAAGGFGGDKGLVVELQLPLSKLETQVRQHSRQEQVGTIVDRLHDSTNEAMAFNDLMHRLGAASTVQLGRPELHRLHARHVRISLSASETAFFFLRNAREALHVSRICGRQAIRVQGQSLARGGLRVLWHSLGLRCPQAYGHPLPQTKQSRSTEHAFNQLGLLGPATL